jgi:hypothetical protein
MNMPLAARAPEADSMCTVSTMVPSPPIAGMSIVVVETAPAVELVAVPRLTKPVTWFHEAPLPLAWVLEMIWKPGLVSFDTPSKVALMRVVWPMPEPASSNDARRRWQVMGLKGFDWFSNPTREVKTFGQPAPFQSHFSGQQADPEKGPVCRLGLSRLSRAEGEK